MYNANSLRLFRTLILVALLALFVGCGGGSGGGGGDTPTPPPTPESVDHDTMLKNLGLDIGNVDPRTNEDGEDIAKTLNPLMKKKSILMKRSEIFLAGMAGQNGNDVWTKSGGTTLGTQQYNVVLDYETDASNPNHTSIAPCPWKNLPKATAAGDLDGDGKEEIFIAYLDQGTTKNKDLKFQIIKKSASSGYSVEKDGTLASFNDSDIVNYTGGLLNTLNNYLYMVNFSAVCADVDGDGASETVVAFNGATYLVSSKLAQAPYSFLTSNAYTPVPGSTTILRMSAGDLDQDGKDELVVTESHIGGMSLTDSIDIAQYHIYKGFDLKQDVANGEIKVKTPTWTYAMYVANCAVGDVNMDGRNEVVFAGRQFAVNESNYLVEVLERVHNSASNQYEYKMDPINIHYSDPESAIWHIIPFCAIADFDGDTKPEILVQRRMMRNLKEGRFLYQQSGGKALDVYNFREGLDPIGSYCNTSLAVGDIDGDTKPEICFLSDELMELYCVGFNSQYKWTVKASLDLLDNDQSAYPSLIMGDFDGDSIAVEYEGTKLLFSDPHPVAVLACPPMWSGINMPGMTWYGLKEGSATTRGMTVGATVGFSFGYKADVLPDVYSQSIKASVDVSWTQTHTVSKQISETNKYWTTQDDYVIYTTIPYDVCYYKIINAPDKTTIGKEFTINVPRTPITQFGPVSDYNANNGSAADIDKTVLVHTIGDPLSYPTPSVAEILIQQGDGQGTRFDTLMTVASGIGAGEDKEISVEKTVANDNAFDFSVSVESEAEVFGFTASARAGFNYGNNYEISTTNGTFFGGSVGSIPADQWKDKAFQWGLFSYRHAMASTGEKFIVVQYYVKDL